MFCIFNNESSANSPTLTGRKSNEIIQGGLSSIKQAATSVAKKLDEIKEAISISANSTPEKRHQLNERGEYVDHDDVHHHHHHHHSHHHHHHPNATNSDLDPSTLSSSRRTSELDLWSKLSESRKSSYNNLVPLGDCNMSTVFPYPVLTVKLYDRDTDDSNNSSGSINIEVCDINIQLTSCSQCHNENCKVLLYDEDIMAGWSAEDSNLNTTCHSCGKFTVPKLSVTLSVDETIKDFKQSDSLTVPYLNPLVLRKELENILAQEGDGALLQSSFVDEHPIIYWNLVWITNRIDLKTHLPQLCLPKPVSDCLEIYTE